MRRRRGIVAGGVFALVFCQAAAGAVERWRQEEIVLTSAATYADPFLEVEVTATFSGPGGAVIERPAFWDGGNSWKVRFAPTEVGEWTMTTTSNRPEDAGLHGVAATIECVAYAGELAVYRHGFPKVAEDGRRFVHADGTPFFYLGDTHWLLLHERFDTSNVEGVPSQFKYTVDKRVGQGFTVYQSEPIHLPHGGEHSHESEEPRIDLRDGFSAEDLPGFAAMDRKFDYIAAKGLVHATGVATWANEPAETPFYTEAYMAKLGRYWVARFGAYPMMWTIAQEIDPNMYGAYNATTIGLWHAAAEAVAESDGYGHPLGAHMQSIANGISHPSQSWWGDKPYHRWWPLQMQNNASSETWKSAAKAFYDHAPVKPLVLYEAPYELFWTDTKGARSAGYRAFQTGMTGYGYGANGTWNDLYAVGDYGTNYQMPGNYLHWFKGANLPGGEQMAHLRKFYTSLDWWKLVPRFDDPAWGALPDAAHSLLASDGNQIYTAYFFGEGTGTGTLRSMEPAAAYEAWWFDPRTGTFSALGGFKPGLSGEWELPARPTGDDWMLLAKRNAAAATVSPANGAALLPAGGPGELSWQGLPEGEVRHVYFGPAGDYRMDAPHGNLARLTPPGGTTESAVELPVSLPGGSYHWIIEWTDAEGVARSLVSSFVVSGSVIPVRNGSFETPGNAANSQGWAFIHVDWNAAGSSQYQQNHLSPAYASHFSTASPGGGNWFALMGEGTGSLRQDLGVSVNAGDTVSVTFHGGRARSGVSTADGGVFTASFLLDGAAHGMEVDTTVLGNDQWQRYTLTKTLAAGGRLGLGFAPVRGNPWLDGISDVTVTPASGAPLSVRIEGPVHGGQFLAGSGIRATAGVTDGTGPYTVRYEWTEVDGGRSGTETGAGAPDHEADLGKLRGGTYQLRAIVTDSAEPPATATSLWRVFRVGETVELPIENASFESPGSLTGGNGWARVSGGWNPAIDSPYQQMALRDLGSAHFTRSCDGGGDWYVLMANVGSIRQNLNRTVKPGDTLSLTFYAGRGREIQSTAAGGVFSAAFLVGATEYSMEIDTSTLPNDHWQPFTLTRTIENEGELSVVFTTRSGNAWLDHLGPMVLSPGDPFRGWIDSQPGTPGGLRGFGDDPNGDGIANGMAWILGGEAMADASGRLPAHRIEDGRLLLSFYRRYRLGRTVLYLDYGTSLDDWTEVEIPDVDTAGVSEMGIDFRIVPAEEFDQVEVRIPLVEPATERFFVRLRANES